MHSWNYCWNVSRPKVYYEIVLDKRRSSAFHSAPVWCHEIVCSWFWTIAFRRQSEPTNTRQKRSRWRHIMNNETHIWRPNFKFFGTVSSNRIYGNERSSYKIQGECRLSIIHCKNIQILWKIRNECVPLKTKKPGQHRCPPHKKHTHTHTHTHTWNSIGNASETWNIWVKWIYSWTTNSPRRNFQRSTPYEYYCMW
jgi:hypothetical protein